MSNKYCKGIHLDHRRRCINQEAFPATHYQGFTWLHGSVAPTLSSKIITSYLSASVCVCVSVSSFHELWWTTHYVQFNLQSCHQIDVFIDSAKWRSHYTGFTNPLLFVLFITLKFHELKTKHWKWKLWKLSKVNGAKRCWLARTSCLAGVYQPFACSCSEYAN